MFKDETTWIVSTGGTFPHWYGMIHIYQADVWGASLFFCMFVCLVVWTVSKFVIGEYQSYTRISDIVLNVMRMMIGNIPKLFPRTARMRIIICLWTIFCFNWMSIYTTSLISMITNPLYSQRVGPLICLTYTCILI